jgi:hypothetical protein
MKIIIETVPTMTHYLTEYGYPEPEIEIPLDLYARYCRARDAWQSIQNELEHHLPKEEK